MTDPRATDGARSPLREPLSGRSGRVDATLSRTRFVVSVLLFFVLVGGPLCGLASFMLLLSLAPAPPDVGSMFWAALLMMITAPFQLAGRMLALGLVTVAPLVLLSMWRPERVRRWRPWQRTLAALIVPIAVTGVPWLVASSGMPRGLPWGTWLTLLVPVAVCAAFVGGRLWSRLRL